LRASRLGFCSLICSFGSAVLACSSGDPTILPIDAPLPDTPSSPPPDTPSNPRPDAGGTCAQRGTLNVTTALDFSTLGQVRAVVPAGDTRLTVVVIVPTDAARTMGFLIVQRNNTGVFATGAAGRFEDPPSLGFYAMDSDASIGFGIDFVDGIAVNADGSVSIHPTQVALLDPSAGGLVRIDDWTPAATPGGTSTIGATFSNARFKGFNILSNGSPDPAGNGCDIHVQNLQFRDLSVAWPIATFPANVTARLPPPPGFGPRTLDAAAVLPSEIALDP